MNFNTRQLIKIYKMVFLILKSENWCYDRELPFYISFYCLLLLRFELIWIGLIDDWLDNEILGNIVWLLFCISLGLPAKVWHGRRLSHVRIDLNQPMWTDAVVMMMARKRIPFAESDNLSPKLTAFLLASDTTWPSRVPLQLLIEHSLDA